MKTKKQNKNKNKLKVRLVGGLASYYNSGQLDLWLASLLLIIAGIILFVSFCKLGHPEPLLNPRVALPKPAQAMEPTSEDCDTPLCYIRKRGEDLGYDSFLVSKFIRVARCESGEKLDQYAKNPYSSAKGIYQFIDGTWRANCLKDGNVYDWKVNIDCFFKVYAKQGFTPWNSSKGCWQ